MGQAVDDILNTLIAGAGLEKEAMPERNMGTPSVPQPEVAPAPVAGEEGVLNPAAKAQERGDSNPANEAMGDDVASQRVKAKQELQAAAGVQRTALSRGEAEEEVSAVLTPQDETIATPAAPPGGPPGQIGEVAPTPLATGDIAQSAAKMSSFVEKEYEQARKLADDAKEKGDTEGYNKHAAEADAYARMAQKIRDDDSVSKNAMAETALREILGQVAPANGAGGEVPAKTAAASTAEGDQAKTAAEEEAAWNAHVEKIASEHIAVGNLVGEAASDVIMSKLAEFIEILPGVELQAAQQAWEKVAKGFCPHTCENCKKKSGKK